MYCKTQGVTQNPVIVKQKEMKDNKELLAAIYSHFPDSEDKDETMRLLITDSIETGITYWNTKWPKVSRPDNKEHYYSEMIWEDVKAGKTFTFGDEDEKGDLNLENILKALEHLKKNSPDVYRDLQDENWDAYTCDEFFQTVVFGEVVFS